jgi:hypothetical protein
MFKKNSNGAILINLLNGNSFMNFTRQLYIMYEKYFINNTNKLLCNNIKLIQYLDKNIDNDKLQLYTRYPCVSFGINNFNISTENISYLNGLYNVSCFTDRLLYDEVYQIYIGDDDVEKDKEFLIGYIKNNNLTIGDAQYSTFISTLFFVKTLKVILNNQKNIDDTSIFDKYMIDSITSVGGNHILNKDHHISMHFLINILNKSGKYQIQHQSFNNVYPNPFMGIYNANFTTSDDHLYYSSTNLQ